MKATIMFICLVSSERPLVVKISCFLSARDRIEGFLTLESLVFLKMESLVAWFGLPLLLFFLFRFATT